MIFLMEGIVMCFVLLIICVIGIANGPVGLVVFYEQDVQDRVVELGYTTKEKIKKTMILTSIALFAPILILVPFMVYYINGAPDFWSVFWQMLIILWILASLENMTYFPMVICFIMFFVFSFKVKSSTIFKYFSIIIYHTS